MTAKKPAVSSPPPLEIITHERYTGRSSDELNRDHGIDGWPCTHQPPHGIRLKAEGKFVVTRHFPDERGYHAITPMRPNS